MLPRMKRQDPKTIEPRLRQTLLRRGFKLVKCRRRDPQAIGFGAYMIVDTNRNSVVAGAHPHEFSFDLEDVERWVRNYERPAQCDCCKKEDPSVESRTFKETRRPGKSFNADLCDTCEAKRRNANLRDSQFYDWIKSRTYFAEAFKP